VKLRLVRPEPPTSLAALRIVVPALVLLAPGLREGVRVAGLDPALRVVPEGLGWFAAIVPIGPTIARGVMLVTAFAALLAIAGVRARIALVAMTLGAFYLYALAEMTGSVWHDMHILWLAALLAASPCDDALAYDRRGEPPAAASMAYGAPLGVARLLLGAVYFFPGFHKLHTSGLAWALSDNLRNQLWWKWAEHGSVPDFRIDDHPWMLHMGGLAVLVFELAAPVLFLVPRTRTLAAAMGVAFHVMAQIVFRIPFLSLWACYVVLIDLHPLLRRFRKRSPSGAPTPTPTPVPIVGALLLLGAIVQGARGQMQSFPFACYPTFEWIVGTEMPDLRIVAILADGREIDVPHARDAHGYRTQRQWGTIWALAGAARAPGDAPLPNLPDRLLAYYVRNARDEPVRSLVRGAVRVRFSRTYVSVDPTRRGEPSLREVPLADVTLTPAS
jgi:hypothetical protein